MRRMYPRVYPSLYVDVCVCRMRSCMRLRAAVVLQHSPREHGGEVYDEGRTAYSVLVTEPSWLLPPSARSRSRLPSARRRVDGRGHIKCPGLHELAATSQQVASGVCLLRGGTHPMRQTRLRYLAGDAGLAAPIPERAAHPMQSTTQPQTNRQLGENPRRDLTTNLCRKHPAAAIRKLPGFGQHLDRSSRQRHPMLAGCFHPPGRDHPTGRDYPSGCFEIYLGQGPKN